MSNPTTRLKLVILVCGLLFAVLPLFGLAQDGPVPPANPTGETTAAEPLEPQTAGSASVWELAVQGGIFMIPIALASIVVLAFSIERFIGLRRTRIIPVPLIAGLSELTTSAGIDPKEAHRLCMENPSPLSTALRAAILKIGRPQPEVEKAAEDAVGREATEMARNLRPVNVVASIGPLLGVMGTVQGMIMAFIVMGTTSSTGNEKAQELAKGIYTALVTTFAGLFVAVLAIILANMLEGKIEKLLKRMEDIFLEIVPLFERYEGKLRVNRFVGEDETESLVLVRSGRKATPAPAANGRPKPKPKSAPEPEVSVEDSVDGSEPSFAPAENPELMQNDDPASVDGPRGLWDVMWEHGKNKQGQEDVASDALEIGKDS
jgi:biopolymer transport protein ExbB